MEEEENRIRGLGLNDDRGEGQTLGELAMGNLVELDGRSEKGAGLASIRIIE